MEKDAKYYVDKFQLQPHPEGGWFAETYRCATGVNLAGSAAGFTGYRSFSTGIYFLLDASSFSAFHRIKSDEMWHFYAGYCLEVFVIDPATGSLHIIMLGNDPDAGEVYQAVVKAGCWFASRVKHPGMFALVGCTVAPGFDFADFEMADGDKLADEFQQHEELIRSLSR
ncbi:MAG TPA: cupin domain-containing protein [Chitinophagales bacterium]|nr:cupin domain-containing protein [Chitinophagales bacterium]